MQDSNYRLLIEKLDEFTRKYYKNLVIRGTIYFFSIALMFYLILVFIEYFAHFNTIIRTLIFYLFIITNSIVILKFIIIPLLKLYKLGKIITHEQAAVIIGKHFVSIKDKLLNVLQLNQLKSTVTGDLSLIEASINQKIIELKPVSFNLAIDFY